MSKTNVLFLGCEMRLKGESRAVSLLLVRFLSLQEENTKSKLINPWARTHKMYILSMSLYPIYKSLLRFVTNDMRRHNISPLNIITKKQNLEDLVLLLSVNKY